MITKSFSSKRIYLGLCALVLVLLAFLLIRSFARESSPATAVSPIIHEGGLLKIPENSPLRKYIQTQVAVKEVVVLPFTLPAIVEADPAYMIKVLPPLAGRIVSLNKRLGDLVQPGDILYTLDSPDLAQALSDVEKAKATLTFTEENLQRQQRLSLSNIAARRELQQAQNDNLQANSELLRANARLQALNVNIGDVHNRLLVSRSPISGQVIELNAAIGGYWNDLTAPIMTVANLSDIYVTASAQEKDLKNLYLNQEVEVILDSYAEHLHSKILFIGAMLNPDTRTIPVQIMFQNNTGQLKPNMFGRAIFLSHPHNRITLPLAAIVQRGFDSVTFVEVAPWQFKPRLVQLGQQIAQKVEVLAGLKPGERVVIKGGIILNDR